MDAGTSALQARITELERQRDVALATAKQSDLDIHTLKLALKILNGGSTNAGSEASKGKRVASTQGLPLGTDPLEFRRRLLEVLRDAPHPLSTAETTDIALGKMDVTLNGTPRKGVSIAANKVLTRAAKAGTLRRVWREGEPLRWEVSR